MHRNNLQQCIADSIFIRKPDLNVVDATLVMTTGGPTGRSRATRRVKMNTLLASRDIVAVDTAAAKMLGVSLERAAHVKLGEALKLGTTDLNKLKIKRIV